MSSPVPLMAGQRCLPPRRPARGAVLRASPVSSASFVSTFLWPCPSLVQPYLYPRRWVVLVVVEAHLGLARVVRLADDVLVREDAGVGKTDAGAVHQRGGAIPTSDGDTGMAPARGLGAVGHLQIRVLKPAIPNTFSKFTVCSWPAR